MGLLKKIIRLIAEYVFIFIAPILISLAYTTNILSIPINFIADMFTLKEFYRENKTIFDTLMGVMAIILPTISYGITIVNNQLQKRKSQEEYFRVLKEKENLENELMLYEKVLAGIEDVVNGKKERFLNHLKTKLKIDPNHTFNCITLPEVQIKLIFANIISIMEEITQHKPLSCSLIWCGKDDNQRDKMKRYFTPDINHKRIPIYELAKTRSTARYILEKKDEIAIIENTDKKDNVWFLKKDSTIKSIISYGYCDSYGMKFIISLSSQTSGVFSRSDKKKYLFIFENFKNRILLETYLMEMKRRVYNGKGSVCTTQNKI